MQLLKALWRHTIWVIRFLNMKMSWRHCFIRPYLYNFLVVKRRKWYKRSTLNFDMALDLDKYTSWCNPCINVIFDSNLYMSTSWIRSLYINCEHEVSMTICNIANEVWMNLLRAYTFTRVSNDNCWWLFLKQQSMYNGSR